MHGQAATSWVSKKQATVALSSCVPGRDRHGTRNNQGDHIPPRIVLRAGASGRSTDAARHGQHVRD
eukprot:6172508-Pleurochrysis_carterae.AAC.1